MKIVITERFCKEGISSDVCSSGILHSVVWKFRAAAKVWNHARHLFYENKFSCTFLLHIV